MSTVSDSLSFSAPSGADAGLTPKQLAAKYGLSVSGKRPGFSQYVRELWARRHFIVAFATARLVAQYTTAKLGQVWQVLTPLLNCVVFYLVFGVMMEGNKGIPDYIAWLCIGVFVFQFSQSAVLSGTRAISDNLGLIRALHFPRAALPIAFTIIQLQQLLISMVVLVFIVLFFQLPTITWLLVVPALLLQCVFNTGLALAMARIGAKTSDMAQLMPFLLRTWMYTSGVMYSVQGAVDKFPAVFRVLFRMNPASIYMDLIRYAFMPNEYNKHALPDHVWLIALAWALVAGVAGFIFFWKAEEEYGRG
ncbi:ABC transporter permease [Kitasatospora sp. NBC_00070]|uniref:ABC transporter permease n=1 Tax=Kitasatospora sp. NBC_00070 TaxID=2975962 RepID=UPI00324408D8